MTETLQEYFKEFVIPYEQAAMAKGEEQGREKGIVQGHKQEALETVRRMVVRGYGDDVIMDATNLSAAEIEKIRKSMN